MSSNAGHHVYRADHLWSGAGWSTQASLGVNVHGHIDDVDAKEGERLRGWVLPGMPNLHSHAFQRAMAGLAEHSGAAAATSNFWTWRETMYAFASRIDPDQLQVGS